MVLLMRTFMNNLKTGPMAAGRANAGARQRSRLGRAHSRTRKLAFKLARLPKSSHHTPPSRY